MKKSILFPGQGSQFIGMGLDFYKNFKVAKDVFDEVDESLNSNLSTIVFEGPKNDLDLTYNTQPAIMATGVAIFRVLQKTKGVKIKDFDFCAGHSLGEYTALVCSDSISLKDASIILRERGKAMQNAVKAGDGAMAAVLGSEIFEIEKIIEDGHFFSVEISNDNCPGQVVISGYKEDVINCCLEIKKKIKKKYILLPVSAPFHCSLMKPASEKIKDLIIKLKLENPKIPIISNVSSQVSNESQVIKELLIEQIYKKVRWREIMESMFVNDVNLFVEIGPGQTLTGMLKRFNREVLTKNFNNFEDLQNDL